VADVPAPMVASTLIGYLLVYAALLIAYVSVLFYLARKATKGLTPEPAVPVSVLQPAE
jgi:cytochrome d ubiquinol oxidase subunit I